MVHDIIQRARAEPNLNSMYRSSMDLNALIQIMFQDRHFINGNRYDYYNISIDWAAGEEAGGKQAGEVYSWTAPGKGQVHDYRFTDTR